MNSFTNRTAAARAIAAFDRATALIASTVANHWPESYPRKPMAVQGSELLDDDDQPFDPPQYGSDVTVMVPDIEASQAFWNDVGTAGFPLCVGHAIMANGANFKHLLAGGNVPPTVMAKGLALFNAAIAFREECRAAEILGELPVQVDPPVTLMPDATGKITASPLNA